MFWFIPERRSCDVAVGQRGFGFCELLHCSSCMNNSDGSPTNVEVPQASISVGTVCNATEVLSRKKNFECFDQLL